MPMQANATTFNTIKKKKRARTPQYTTAKVTDGRRSCKQEARNAFDVSAIVCTMRNQRGRATARGEAKKRHESQQTTRKPTNNATGRRGEGKRFVPGLLHRSRLRKDGSTRKGRISSVRTDPIQANPNIFCLRCNSDMKKTWSWKIRQPAVTFTFKIVRGLV